MDIHRFLDQTSNIYELRQKACLTCKSRLDMAEKYVPVLKTEDKTLLPRPLKSICDIIRKVSPIKNYHFTPF